MPVTPKQCAEASEKHIGEYVKEVGAYGDATDCMRALEMLVSKCSLGYAQLIGGEKGAAAVTDMLLRTSLNVSKVMAAQQAMKDQAH